MTDSSITACIQESYASPHKHNMALDSPIKATPYMAQTYFMNSSLIKKTSIKQSQNMVVMHFRKINSIIDTLDDHINQKLENHEMEMLAIVKNQIDEMKSQTRIMVEKLNHMINVKSNGDDIWNLNNELEYFKNQTHTLFKQNKRLRGQISSLAKKIKQLTMQLQNNDKVMQKLKKSCMRDKLLKVKNERQKEHDKNESLNHSLNLKTENKTRRNFQTEPDQFKHDQEQKFIQSKININVPHHKDLAPLTAPDQYAKINEKISIPNLSLHQNGRSQMKMKWVDSFFVESQAKTSMIKLDQGMQTELFEQMKKSQSTHKNKNAPLYIAESNMSRYTNSLDLTKNGFFIKTCKQKSNKVQSFNSQGFNCCQQDMNLRAMSHTLNRNKMKKTLRQMINKSSLQ